MFTENPRGLCKIYKTSKGWVCDTPDGKTSHNTRQSARNAARNYRAERAKLVREFYRQQGESEFYA